MFSLKSVPLIIAGVTAFGAPIVNPDREVEGAQFSWI